MTATYVYGLVAADTQLPDALHGLGPTGRVSTITHGGLTAIVGDVPQDRPLGQREDLIAHESVLDTVAATTTVLPMRFPSVVEADGVVEELLAPNEEFFSKVLDELAGRVQFALKGRYEQDVVLREIVEADPQIRQLQERVRAVPEDASYYDRVRLGELIVGALEQRREQDAERCYERLQPFVVRVAPHEPGAPEQLIDAAFLVDREQLQRFDDAVEELGRDLAGRARLRLIGPLAPYDFVPRGV